MCKTTPWLPIALLLLVGCNAKEKQAQAKLDELTRVAQAKIRALTPVAEELATIAPLTVDAVNYDGPPLTEASIVDAGNIAVVEVQSLCALTKTRMPTRAELWTPLFGAPPWQLATELMSRGKPFIGTDADSVARTFRGVVGLEYVLAVKTISMTKPVLHGSTYDPGLFSGEARLWAIDGARDLGGFRFTATDAPDVLVESKRGSSDGTKTLDARRMLDSDFTTQIRAALTASVRKYIHGAVIKEGLSW
jgi:hypothetical protein